MKNPFDVNQYTFNNSEESFEYDSSNVSDLQSPERFIIDKITPYIKNTAILDLAVGGGRTTQHLLKISKNCIGTEVSNSLLKVAKKTS